MNIPPEQYYKSLGRKWIGSGALFFDDAGRLLIVKPTYKKYWEIPGGAVNENESPLEACIREIKEELGLDVKPSHLLCLDYISNSDQKGDRLMFVFDGGLLPASDAAKIKLLAEELSEYRFVTIDEAVSLLGDRLKKRIPRAVEARSADRCVYLEDGE